MCAFLTTVLFIATATLANGFEKTTSESTYISEISLNNSLHKKSYQNSSNYQTFRIDFENNVFLKDGKPFQSVSGEFEHFRAHPQKWRQILRTMRAAGLNTVSTYAEWSFHNPHDGQYVWTGMANIEKFVRIAAEEDLLVIFRLGPYINAERNGGGFPHWLLAKYPRIVLRSRDPDYLQEVRLWFSKMLPRIAPYLYGNGGPIIMVQVENQYGQYGCDDKYMEWMRDEIYKYIDDNAVMITNNLPNEMQIACTKVKQVLVALDFIPANSTTINEYRKVLRKFQPRGPLMVAEFYTHWPINWGQSNINTITSKEIADSLRVLLQQQASVNLYTFYGGNNYGFSSGANISKPFITSYGNSAPIDVTGAVSEKYFAIRNVIREFFPLPNIPTTRRPRKMLLPPVKMQPITTLFSSLSRRILSGKTLTSREPCTFEQLHQNAGYVLYEKMLPKSATIPSTLHIPEFRDRAYIYVNNRLISVLIRDSANSTAKINAGPGHVLQILVENQGRQSGKISNETKGIVSDVLLNDKALENWNITSFPFENETRLNQLMNALPLVQQEQSVLNRIENRMSANFTTDPIIFRGSFDINEIDIYDTFIDPRGWGKGFIFLNGFNLGRYWPTAGPQLTLYVPKEILMRRRNTIVIVESEKAPLNGVLRFSGRSIFLINNTLVYDY